MEQELTVALVGNPNCGKTTLFNAITGENQKTANWPGVTVEKKTGKIHFRGNDIKLLDLPGLYSLNIYSLEEQVTLKELETADVIIHLIDSDLLERSLVLTLQLLTVVKVPVILAINTMNGDNRIPKGQQPADISGLAQQAAKEAYVLGRQLPEPVSVPDRICSRAVTVNALAGEGIEELLGSVLQEKSKSWKKPEEAYTVTEYSDGLWDKLYQKIDRIMECWNGDQESNKSAPQIQQKKKSRTEAWDRFLLHPFWGTVSFFAVIAAVFFFTFWLGDILQHYFQTAIRNISELISGILQLLHTNAMVNSLVLDGIVAGVGSVLSFLPNLAILFLAMAILEDSGYMARVACICDRLGEKLGLSGRSFIPLLLGFGCTVPAVMATRTLPTMEGRKRTILLLPFMSCSAKLPIYVLFTQLFFHKYRVLVAFSLYLLGILLALAGALLMQRLQPKQDSGLLLELPEYRRPAWRNLKIYVGEKIKEYIGKAGTTIFLASVLLWYLLNFNGSGVCTVTESFGAVLGKMLVPILSLAGLGMWQIGLALVCGLSAKEVVVSSFGIIFGLQNAVNTGGALEQLVLIFGNAGFGPLNAFAFLVFCLLYTPCVAALGCVYQETRSLKLTVGMVVAQLLLAYAAAVLVYQTGSLCLKYMPEITQIIRKLPIFVKTMA